MFSEAFPTHDMARRAAERAAAEQMVPGETTSISYEDKDGHWHDEVSAGDDRPDTVSRADERCGSPAEIAASK